MADATPYIYDPCSPSSAFPMELQSAVDGLHSSLITFRQRQVRARWPVGGRANIVCTQSLCIFLSNLAQDSVLLACIHTALCFWAVSLPTVLTPSHSQPGLHRMNSRVYANRKLRAGLTLVLAGFAFLARGGWVRISSRAPTLLQGGSCCELGRAKQEVFGPQ